MNLQLVEDTRRQCRLCRVRAVDQDVALTCGGLRLRHSAGDPIRYIINQWILRERWAWWPVTRNIYWDAIVVVATPVVGLFHSVATGEDGTSFLDFVKKVLAHHRRFFGLLSWPNV